MIVMTNAAREYVRSDRGRRGPTDASRTRVMNELVELTDIKYFVFYAMRVGESAFGDTALDRHLATFVRLFILVTGTALSALVTFCRGSAFTAGFTASDSFFFVRSAFCRPERM